MSDYSGPPEPVVSDDEIELLYVDEDKREVAAVELGTWECQRCGSHVSPGVENGELVDPYCAHCERDGPFDHVGDVSQTDVRTAIKADDMWHPPTGYDETGFGDLWNDIRQFIYDHWDAGNDDNADAIYDGLTAYALTTWLRPNLTFVPHLMLMGKTTGGKTRLLNTLARVSYRAVVSASATPATLYRMIDAYDVTFFVSEYHGLPSDSRRELDNVVRAGQKRNEVVTRAEQTSSGYEPKTYDPFSHIAIATQYEPDDDIVNRCVQVPSSPATRDMPPTHDEERAADIRNRLLHARYRLLDSGDWAKAENKTYEYLAEENITDRTREKLLSLITVARLWGRMDDIEPFVETVVQQDQQAAADSEDARVVEAIRDAARERVNNQATIGSDPYSAVKIPYEAGEDAEYSGVVERFEAMTGIEKSAHWAGHVVKRLDLEKERTRDGTVISDPELGPKLRKLCDDLNLEWNPDASTSQKEAYEQLHETVRSYEEENGTPVPKSIIISELNEEIPDRDAEYLIESATSDGKLYEPEEDHVATP